MKKETLYILNQVKNGELSVEDAYDEIMNIHGLSKSSVLCGGDKIGEYGERHREEAELIKEVLIENGFINAGLNDAIWLWGEYSDSYCAGWLGLPDEKEEIYDCIKRYIVKTHYCG
jgi:hypothetical protein